MITRTYFFSYIYTGESDCAIYNSGRIDKKSWLPLTAIQITDGISDWIKEQGLGQNVSILCISRIS